MYVHTYIYTYTYRLVDAMRTADLSLDVSAPSKVEGRTHTDKQTHPASNVSVSAAAPHGNFFLFFFKKMKIFSSNVSAAAPHGTCYGKGY